MSIRETPHTAPKKLVDAATIRFLCRRFSALPAVPGGAGRAS
jgi:hypothetical protein